MLDFLFRRGNPTNQWRRAPDLKLTAALDMPSLNGVVLGAAFDGLSSLGRNDCTKFDTLCYLDLGVGVTFGKDGTLQGYTIVFEDEENEFQPYQGTLSWKRLPVDMPQMSRDDLTNILGDWYWLDTDETESIAFYEYPKYEIQIEFTLTGTIKRLILTKDPILAVREQREAYNVTKPWPPRYNS